MNQWVEIEFDCLPLRSVGRVDIPIDASPGYRRFCEQVKKAIDTHGSHNTYFLHHAHCAFRVLNHDKLGRIEFSFEGTLFTDPEDRKALGGDLEVTLVGETCDWLTQPIVEWFQDTVRRAVAFEFDRYIEAGDLDQTKARLARLQEQTESTLGFLGMDV